MRALKACVLTACLLSACAEMPSGPTVATMPGPYKPFEVFQADDAVCRQYAQSQIGQSPGEAAASSTAAGAVTGAAVGAAAGALIGRGGEAAATGAGVGLLAGTAIGAESGNRSAGYLQYRYNVAYEQCMYARGNQVPGFAAGTAVPPPPPPPPPAASPP
ncbi:MAG: hypothetical protein P4L83_01805 [Nevskia sp.]|nr:hypothetical protein [Nevskia sp.]